MSRKEHCTIFSFKSEFLCVATLVQEAKVRTKGLLVQKQYLLNNHNLAWLFAAAESVNTQKQSSHVLKWPLNYCA